MSSNMDGVPIKFRMRITPRARFWAQWCVYLKSSIRQTMSIGSNSSFVHRQSGNPVGLCDAKYSQRSHRHIYIYIHVQPCDKSKKSLQENVRSVANFSANGKRQRKRDLKSGNCVGTLCEAVFRVVRNIRHSARFLRLAKSQDEKAAERIPVHTHHVSKRGAAKRDK